MAEKPTIAKESNEKKKSKEKLPTVCSREENRRRRTTKLKKKKKRKDLSRGHQRPKEGGGERRAGYARYGPKRREKFVRRNF